jgi:hypothetical protein
MRFPIHRAKIFRGPLSFLQNVFHQWLVMVGRRKHCIVLERYDTVLTKKPGAISWGRWDYAFSLKLPG